MNVLVSASVQQEAVSQRERAIQHAHRGELAEAAAAFVELARTEAATADDFSNLAEVYLQQLNVSAALSALRAASARGFRPHVGKAVRATSLIAEWQQWQELRDAATAQVRAYLNLHIEQRRLYVPPQLRLADAPDVPIHFVVPLQQLISSTFAVPASQSIAAGVRDASGRLDVSTSLRLPQYQVSVGHCQLLKVGFLSADLDVHPVAQLLRGALLQLSTEAGGSTGAGQQCTRTQVFVYALNTGSSFWRRQIEGGVHVFRALADVSVAQAAAAIAADSLHLLVDLHGHTAGSGLPIMALRPALVQATYLGSDATTALPAIDYMVTDSVALPLPFDGRSIHFVPGITAVTERLVMFGASPHTPFMVADYANLQLHVLTSPRPSIAAVCSGTHGLCVRGDGTPSSSQQLSSTPLVFGVFSNYGKFDPVTFTTWMNVLRRHSHAILWIPRHRLWAYAEPRLAAEAAARGIHPSRLLFSESLPWMQHVRAKGAAHIYLDTCLKNGHATTVDALWAGLPVVTCAGDRAGNRIASSLVHSLPSPTAAVGITYSLQEYEQVASLISGDGSLLRGVSAAAAAGRTASSIFNTSSWAQQWVHRAKQMVEVCGSRQPGVQRTVAHGLYCGSDMHIAG